VMGLGGTLKYGWSGLVDIRLAMIILAGSLFGIQLGAIGTTYVKPSMIKVVMGVIMVMVLFSRAVVIPVYLAELEIIGALHPHLISGLKNVSFVMLIGALATGAAIVFASLWRGITTHRRELELAEAPGGETVAVPQNRQLSPVGRFESFLVAVDSSEFSSGAVREALRMAQKCGARLHAISVVATGTEHAAIGEQPLKQEMDAAQARLDQIKTSASENNIACETHVIQGNEPFQDIVNEAERLGVDLIIVGRRGGRGLARYMVGDATVKIIGHAHCSVLVVPRSAYLEGRHFILALDGSRHSDAAAVAAANLAKYCRTAVTALSAILPGHGKDRRRDAKSIVSRALSYLKQEHVAVTGENPTAERPDAAIIDTAKRENADLIILGSHGRTGIERILLGSTAERVLDQTTCAVLVVKAG